MEPYSNETAERADEFIRAHSKDGPPPWEGYRRGEVQRADVQVARREPGLRDIDAYRWFDPANQRRDSKLAAQLEQVRRRPSLADLEEELLEERVTCRDYDRFAKAAELAEHVCGQFRFQRAAAYHSGQRVSVEFKVRLFGLLDPESVLRQDTFSVAQRLRGGGQVIWDLGPPRHLPWRVRDLVFELDDAFEAEGLTVDRWCVAREKPRPMVRADPVLLAHFGGFALEVASWD
jgi:hypothetical protein